MRHWLFTNTTYGTWLPGNERGSVTSVRDRRSDELPTGSRLEHDQFGTPWEQHIPGIHSNATSLLKCPPIFLTLSHAEILLAQFIETAKYRERTLHAVSIMSNHWHMVVTVPGDPDPNRVLTDIKAYASRALNRVYGKPASNTWWTMRGSKRKLATDAALAGAINYTLYKQPNPLVVWSPEHGRII
jgi:REP element-mobilizing transposase RayT